ncbi:MAG TPA: CBS domain-containing protein [Gemmatimonadaceae bacterium]|nr:CBS domain-containing protein [Gemmatimonadaceae bacterium]
MSAEERLALALVAEHPEDAARLIERADPADAAALLGRIPPAMAAEAFKTLGPSAAAACASELDEDRLGAIIEALPLDVASAILRRASQVRRDNILAAADEERGARLRSLLAFAENTAGAAADPDVVALVTDTIAEDARRQLREVPGHLLTYLYIVTRDRTLAGALNIGELMAAAPKQTLAGVMHADPVRLDANTDIATVTAHPAWRDFDALPVVDSAGKLVGAIRHKTIRRMSLEGAHPVVATIVGLSELYWTGLSGMLASLLPAQTEGEDESDGS